jgi:hypothetical protein
MFFDGFLCLTWGGYPDTLAPCCAPCKWNTLARSITEWIVGAAGRTFSSSARPKGLNPCSIAQAVDNTNTNPRGPTNHAHS